MSIKEEYRDGAEGLIRWAEDKVCVPIYPEGSPIPVWCPMGNLPTEPNPDTGRSYRTMWEEQKEVLREALRMENGRFKYRLLVFCWPRGEGKSFIVCLIKAWRFFNWTRQMIMLGANSKDQVKFVHYDMIRDMILHSPRLIKEIGRKTVKIKDITIKDRKANVTATIRCVSTFSGIFSNITGYTFSEMFAQKNNTFFVQIDGSIRNVPNAMGCIDSTVSSKVHQLYRLYETFTKGADPSLFFSYRYSEKGDPNDYWHPNMTAQQLESYREKFPLGDFERYFLNLWSAGAENVFTEEMVRATNYIGADNVLHNHKTVIELINHEIKIVNNYKKVKEDTDKMGGVDIWTQDKELDEIARRLMPIENIYSLRTQSQVPRPASMDDLSRLSDVFDTDWLIMGGMDRADPMKTRTAARSILGFVAKGLIGSRSNPPMVIDDRMVPYYFYLLLHLLDIKSHSIEEAKAVIQELNAAYDGIDTFCAETWGMVDLPQWFEDEGISCEIVFPNYTRQKAAFSEVYNIYDSGRFKAPPVAVPGSKGPDILQEEPLAFNHNPDPPNKGFFSVEKKQKFGIQDDVMYMLGWCIYGGRMKNFNDFRPRTGKLYFGEIFHPKGLLGNY